MSDRKVRVINVPSELGAGTRGASLGFEAIKVAIRNKKSKFLSNKEIVNVPTHNDDYLDNEIISHNALRIDGILKQFKQIIPNVSSAIKEGCFPLIVAGDHSSAAGTIAGIKDAIGNKRVGVVWIDAHADLHSPYTSPSGNMHGMPLAIASNTDNLDCMVNNVKEITKEKWEELKALGANGKNINIEDIVFIGVRDTEKPEDYLIKKHEIKNFTVQEVREIGVEATVSRTFEILSDCDVVYVSFDVDSMDPSVSRGTGTPVDGGFSVNEAKSLTKLLFDNKKVIAFELVEVNPCLDDKINTMAETSLDILENLGV